MEWFHHPDFCPRLVVRRAAEELLDLSVGMIELVLSRGRAGMVAPHLLRPGEVRYRMAQHRLRKAGFLAVRRARGQPPVFRLTPEGERKVPDLLRPERRWNRAWSGRWQMLVYDVPETERAYRNHLRAFLRRMRMGRLQNSVWITPDDIRAEYADLMEAAAVEDYAMLVEARTVLGNRGSRVARIAWNLDRIDAGHAWYLQAVDAALDRVAATPPTRQQAWTIVREDLNAYRAVMADDPLLPRALWPDGYRGPAVVAAHRRLVEEVWSAVR